VEGSCEHGNELGLECAVAAVMFAVESVAVTLRKCSANPFTSPKPCPATSQCN
jgi:hypothetical protein